MLLQTAGNLKYNWQMTNIKQDYPIAWPDLMWGLENSLENSVTFFILFFLSLENKIKFTPTRWRQITP